MSRAKTIPQAVTVHVPFQIVKRDLRSDPAPGVQHLEKLVPFADKSSRQWVGLVISANLAKDLPLIRPSFIMGGYWFDSRQFRVTQARRARSLQIAQASGALVRGWSASDECGMTATRQGIAQQCPERNCCYRSATGPASDGRG